VRVIHTGFDVGAALALPVGLLVVASGGVLAVGQQRVIRVVLCEELLELGIGQTSPSPLATTSSPETPK
jgi:hypothetical protein